MSETRYFRVSGKVQGVSFRAGTQAKAQVLNLSGWVANRDDGDVELMARGDRAALDDLHAWLQQGPEAARVDRLQARPVSDKPDLPREFAVR